MTTDGNESEQVSNLLATPSLADALESDQFKEFLDHVPVSIAVAELLPSERIVYVNVEFERLTARAATDLVGNFWDKIPGVASALGDDRTLGSEIVADQDYLGAFSIENEGGARTVDAWSNVIQDDEGKPVFRLVALVQKATAEDAGQHALEDRIREKDTLLRELQHRVKNNLQMITGLIRMETRNHPEGSADERFHRLAGRVEALALLYNSLSEESHEDVVDLGVYLSQIASAVIRAHAPQGIRLDLQVDTWPVSINVAMPTGLVVNELLTNSLKHAFHGREGGTISLHSFVENGGCRVTVADDGVGLPENVTWPKPGKLSALIVRSLRQNAKAEIDVSSDPGTGMSVTITFASAPVPSTAP
jgi:two-component sensor histidine kinase